MRSYSAPLRRGRSSCSVLESALVGLGREDAVVRSTRKRRKKRGAEASRSPLGALRNAFSAPEHDLNAGKRRPNEEEEENPFAHLVLWKSHAKKKRKRAQKEEKDSSPAVTRSAAKEKKERHTRCHAGVLENIGRTPVTRSMVKEKRKEWERSSFELIGIEEDEVVIQKKLFHSIEKKKKKEKEKKKKEEKKEEEKDRVETTRGRMNRKATVLEQWRVEWPPVLERDDENDVEKVLLVLIGRVLGKLKRFAVGKREGATRFTSKEGEYVALSGKMDRNVARKDGVPRAAIELMEGGIPAYFDKRLLPYAQKSRDKVKGGRSRVKVRSGAKKAMGAAKSSSSMPLIAEEINSGAEATADSTPIQDDVLYSTPRPKKIRAQAYAQVQRQSKKKKKEEPEPEAEMDVWTTEQQEALMEAKLKIPTTASNFWAQVAQYVPGKTAKDCQSKTFEVFRSPPSHRKGAKKNTRQASSKPQLVVPAKIARAGSNKFKKQVREFVEEYEKKHLDDLFDTTPSKEGLPELPEFDSIKSPELGTPSRSFDDDDSEMDDEALGLLKKLSSRKRDDIDSYVLGINRLHVAGGGVMAGGKVRRVTSAATPEKPKGTSAKKKSVMVVEEVGSRFLKGVVSPGGTTRVCIEKDGSSSEEDDDEYHSSEEEDDFDLP